MTVRFVHHTNPNLKGPARVYMTAEIPVGEISFEKGRYMFHYHPIAGQMSPADQSALAAAIAQETNRMNAPLRVAERLKGGPGADPASVPFKP